jgi:hypothetical protein
MSIFLGPILAIIINDDIKETNKERHDRQRRWFQTNTPLNRSYIPGYRRSIPPPPPITRRGPSHVELNRAERLRVENLRDEWRRQNGYSSKLNDFKFFRK